jgi:hypothetical protein
MFTFSKFNETCLLKAPKKHNNNKINVQFYYFYDTCKEKITFLHKFHTILLPLTYI